MAGHPSGDIQPGLLVVALASPGSSAIFLRVQPSLSVGYLGYAANRFSDH